MNRKHLGEIRKEALRVGVWTLAGIAALGGNYWARHSHNIFKDAKQGIQRVVKPPVRPPLPQVTPGQSVQQALQQQRDSRSKYQVRVSDLSEIKRLP
jgi:hypothetical protein